MANYIPVLDDPVFLAGLIVFGIGVRRADLRGWRRPAAWASRSKAPMRCASA